MIDGKIYAQSNDILLLDHGIFLNLEGHLLAVENIGFDTNGIYCGWGDKDDELWECLRCGTLNKMKYYRCTNCGWDRRN